MHQGPTNGTVAGMSEALDHVFQQVLLRRGVVTPQDLGYFSDRPLSAHLVASGVIPLERANAILNEIGSKTLFCERCSSLYLGVSAVDGKKYQCRKCNGAIAYPQTVTIEARNFSFPAAPKGGVRQVPVIPVQERAPETTRQTAPVGVSLRWFIAVNGQKTGPLTNSQMSSKIEAGEVDHTTLVWRKGMKQWQSAAQVSDLEDLLADVPPPLEPVAAYRNGSGHGNGNGNGHGLPVQSVGEVNGATQQVKQSAPSQAVSEAEYEESRDIALMSYIFLPIAFFMKRSSAFARYHFRQGLGSFVVGCVAGAGLMILQKVAYALWGPDTLEELFVGGGFYGTMNSILMLVSVGFGVFGIYLLIKGIQNVVARRMVPLPIIPNLPGIRQIVAPPDAV